MTPPSQPGEDDVFGRPARPINSAGVGREESTGATLRAFIGVLRRRLPFLIICTILVPVAALFWSLGQEKEYSSSASLLFRSAEFSLSPTGSPFFSSSGDPTRAAQTNVNLVALGDVANRTAKRLAIPGLTAGAVAGSIDVSAEGESEIANVAATTTEPELSARMANVFAEEYIAVRRDADRRAVLDAKDRIEAELNAMAPEQREGPQGERLTSQVEELAALATLQTGNAELVQRATANDTPVAPHPRRNVVLGIVVGMLLGIGLALLLEQFDTRIRDEGGIEEAYGLPILARIPRGKIKPPDAIDPIGMGLPGSESFRMLHANLRYFNVDRKIDSLLITSAAPGDGKTTVSWGLAVTEARSGKSVLLIEGDMRQPTLSGKLDGDHGSGLSLVLAGSDTLDNAVVPVEAIGNGNGELHVLSAGPTPPNSAELLESPRMAELLRDARERYDLVVVDAPPTVVSDAIPLMPQVSGVLVIARLGRSRRDVARDLRELLTNINALPLGVVVTGAAPAREGYYMPQQATVPRDAPA